MMPDLRALFDLPRRLLPGKGVKMLGYGDKKTIAGMQATGVNSALTLSRSEKSCTMPSLGTDEEPVALRAGPGVRLHGYGGIHTLERLPEALIEEAVLGPARLEWEIEMSWGSVSICALGESAVSPRNWITVRNTTYNFTGGSYTDTTTASGVTTPYGPDDPTPDACALPVDTSTYDPGVSYGTFIDSSVAETLVSFSSLASSAVAALGVFSTSEAAQEWRENTWKDVSPGVTPFSFSFGTVAMGYGIDPYSGGSVVRADNLRFRLTNTGSVSLRVNCGFYGSGISGGATDLESVIDLAPKASSAWQEVPSIDDDPDKYRTAEIRRVRIERWRNVA